MRFTFLNSLSARLKFLTVVWVSAALASIIFTLLLSWRLEGSAAAINDAGSLRMQAYRLGLMLREQHNVEHIDRKIAQFDTTLQQLERGDSVRPLSLPDTPEVGRHMENLKAEWQHIKLQLQSAAHNRTGVEEKYLNQFVASIDDLVSAVEVVNSRHTYWLRLFQSGLMAMVLIGAGVMVVLLYLWIIRPMEELQNGVERIHDGKLGTQVPINELAEFAQLDKGFNQMSKRLQQLYANLEHEVAEKTRDLADKNYTLQTLYSFSRFLNQTQTAAEAGTMFLEKIMRLIPARAGSIRLLDFRRHRMDLVAHQGLPDTLQNAEACQRLEDCFCGKTVQQSGWQPIHFDGRTETSVAMHTTGCEKSGFHYLQVFKIRHSHKDLGIMTLYFDEEYAFNTNTTHLLDSLCNLLGLVLTNIRLADESRQLAVLQERNLMAQGLHDSIAQTLTFLNLQVQMLESAMAAGNQNQMSENLQFIKDGVQECYEDVRELLLNFRTKISKKEFAEAVQTLAARFRQQTQTDIEVVWHGDGPNLSSEQQLQFIFILQESLSNIRKHAQAASVKVTLDNERDFVMTITDDGKGFAPASLENLSGSHVGLNIMRERALRIHARLDLDSQPGQYTQVRLTLPQEERILI
ncbi:MAG: type IV pili methyl-accepting chemotaxis transducer N-terminal domain-containing protein [Neisseria zoodegmatis]|uniref:type IV pili methyl-accepting chemotaxis transducer N-terminal domain-containing protein n=1 Tax=Neisseria zoodegmatis TaxID=326523 RepID=UPI0026EE9D3D|nr:type IV pili methyl-accepting chemotaxis transducer N-terminal domain-containing protein [Neisseria zoodegmatis]MDO5069396.1 type IV pili methyl-accepting chemotaxis transducer N-terminal domain-containing protein [Neisseria zoodegmatis]